MGDHMDDGEEGGLDGGDGEVPGLDGEDDPVVGGPHGGTGLEAGGQRTEISAAPLAPWPRLAGPHSTVGTGNVWQHFLCEEFHFIILTMKENKINKIRMLFVYMLKPLKKVLISLRRQTFCVFLDSRGLH